MATRRTNPNIYRENNAPYSKTPQQLEERKEKGLCFNCDNKYSKGHKFGEKKLFSRIRTRTRTRTISR